MRGASWRPCERRSLEGSCYDPRVEHGSWTAGIALALAACSSGTATGVRPRIALSGAQRARVERVHGELEASLGRIEAWGLDELVSDRAESLLGELGDEPYARYPDWVLARRELSFLVELAEPSDPGGTILEALDTRRPDHPIHVIEAFAEAFHEHGIDFLVVPIPRRVQIHPDRLPGVEAQGEGFSGVGEVPTRFLLALAERGVESVDLLPLLAADRGVGGADDDRDLFHAYNNHWTPRGARIAADAVARRIREIEGAPSQVARSGVDFQVRREQVDYELPPLVPEAEEPVPVWVDRVLTPEGEPVAYRDRASPLLLLGDSHCHWYGEELGADLGAQLYARLGAPLDAIVLNDGGAEAVWANLARRDDQLAGKRLVVWMFDANVLLDERLQYVELFTE